MRKQELRADRQRYLCCGRDIGTVFHWCSFPAVLLGFWFREQSPVLLICAIFFLILALLSPQFFPRP